jgi:hypothetical protein
MAPRTEVVNADAERCCRTSLRCIGCGDWQCARCCNGKVQCIKGTKRDVKSADPAPRGEIGGSIQLKPNIRSTLEMPNEDGRDASSVLAREFPLSDLPGHSGEELHFSKVA